MCDFVHVLWLKRIEAQVLVEQQIAVALAPAGVKDLEFPDLSERLAAFDELLHSEPEAKALDTPEMAELKQLLGVG